MRNPQIRFTYSDYLLLPENDRRELIEGDFYVAPSPIFRHQNIAARLGAKLRIFADINSLGHVVSAPMDVVLDDENVVQPDILFVSNERSDIIKDYIFGAPDLVIEILSPSTADRDKQLKLSLYTRYGVREYWIVDPEQNTIQVIELDTGGPNVIRMHTSGSVTSALLPGLDVPLDEVFAS